MSIHRLIPIAVTLALIASATGRLPQIILRVKLAQLQLIKESQASKWGRPLLLPAVDRRN